MEKPGGSPTALKANENVLTLHLNADLPFEVISPPDNG